MRFNPWVRKCTILLVFFLVFSFNIYAEDLEIKIYRDSYNQFETVQAEVMLLNGTFSADLKNTNLELLSSGGEQVQIAKNIVKINNTKFLYYFDLPDLSAGVYELIIKDVSYVRDGGNYFSDFNASLSVADNDVNILSVRPAYVVNHVGANEEASFSLVLTNKGTNGVNVNLIKSGDFFSLQQSSFSLNPGQTKNSGIITFLGRLDGSEFDGKISVNYGNKFYEIPFLVFRSGDLAAETTENVTVEDDVLDLGLIENPVLITTLSGRELENLTLSIDVNDYYPPGQIIIKNNAGADLENIMYILRGNITGILEVSPLVSEVIGINESAVVLVSVNDNKEDFENGYFSGAINIEKDSIILGSLPIFLEIYGVTEEIVNNSIEIITTKNETISTTEIKGQPNIGLWIFLIFIVFLLFILFYIYRKTKRKKEEFENYIERIKR